MGEGENHTRGKEINEREEKPEVGPHRTRVRLTASTELH